MIKNLKYKFENLLASDPIVHPQVLNTWKFWLNFEESSIISLIFHIWHFGIIIWHLFESHVCLCILHWLV